MKKKEIIGAFEYVEVSLKNSKTGKKKKVLAKIDTGALSSSMCFALAEELGCYDDILKLKDNYDPVRFYKLKKDGKIKKTKIVKNPTGFKKRIFVDAEISIKNENILTHVNLVDRKKMRHDLLIGRRDIKKFLVDPGLNVRLNKKEKIMKASKKEIKRVIILDRKRKDEVGQHIKDIHNTFDKYIKTESLDTADNLLFDLSSKKIKIIKDNKEFKIKDTDFVFARYRGSNVPMTGLLAMYLKKNNIRNSFNFMAERVNKSLKHYQYLYFKLHNIGVETPKTMLGSAETILNNFSYIKEKLGKEFVVKASGSRGKFVFLVKTKKELKEIFDEMEPAKTRLIAVQEKIDSSFDVRVIVVKGKIFSVMKRESEDFLNNYSQGGGVDKFELDDLAKEMVLNAASIYELDFVGVDLMFKKKKPLVIEVQVGPQTDGMREAYTDRDFAEDFVKEFLK
jgi:glutathione synthase/RimK-type ligase-like ATP-grasp enzyme